MKEDWLTIDTVPESVLKYPERVVSLLSPFLTTSRKEKIEKVLDQRIGGLKVVFDRPYDPHNCAAALRSCEAFGVQYIDVIRHPERDFYISKKVTQGSHKWLFIKIYRDQREWLKTISQFNGMIIGCDPRGETISNIEIKEPLIIIIGNEHDGLSPEIKAICHRLVSIPMFGFVESFNLSVSTALVLSKVVERLKRGDLSEEERLKIKAIWYYRSCGHSDQILKKHGLI